MFGFNLLVLIFFGNADGFLNRFLADLQQLFVHLLGRLCNQFFDPRRMNSRRSTVISRHPNRQRRSASARIRRRLMAR